MDTYEKNDTLWKWGLRQFESASGRRAIDDWRLGLKPMQRADLDTFVKLMVKKYEWEFPHIKALKRPHNGLTELRWSSGNVQHRLIGYQCGDHQFMLLIGCTHKQRRYDPPNALDTAVNRRKMISNGEAGSCEFTLITAS